MTADGHIAQPSPRLGVYIHWPYCARICPYCDFNVYKNRDVDDARWVEALKRDLTHWRGRTGGRDLHSIYWGGGTPSLAPVSLVETIIDHCRTLWSPVNDLEVTLEANPTDAETERLAGFRAGGVNRLSLGVQSLQDGALEFLGRNHDSDAARRAIGKAVDVFHNVSLDLIYARPGQSLDAWKRELEEAIAFGAPHLSLYQLTIEPKTAFANAVGRGAFSMPPEEMSADFYTLTQDVTAAAGFGAYEVSNHARDGYHSRHNALYWNADDYVGVGPGAHGRLTVDGTRFATEAARAPETYLMQTEQSNSGIAEESALSDEEERLERITMGLRRREGVRLYDQDRGDFQDRLAMLIAEELLVDDGENIAATPKGRLVLNAVLSNLLL